MMSRFIPRRACVSTAVVVMLVLAGCASRSLNAPPVVEWSNGQQPGALPPQGPSGQQLYTVGRDDTLASIAKRFNTTISDLAAWNDLGPAPRLRVDQVLRVTPPGPAMPDAGAPTAIAQPIGSETVEQRPLGGQQGVPAVGPTTPATAPSNAPLKTGPLGIKRPYSDATLAELSRTDGDASTAAAPLPAVVAPAMPVPGSVAWSWPATGKPTVGFDGKTKGIDIPGKVGDPVLAAADGKVTFAGSGVRGYGNFVIVRHTPELLSVYAHNRTNLVKEGAVVTKGQKIAEMGNSDTDAVKLHFEIRDDSKPIDPMKYLPGR